MGFHRYCRCIAFVALGLLAAAPAAAQPAVDFKLFFASQTGDFIGDGQTKTYTQADGNVSISSSATTVRVGIDGPSFNFWWDATFSAPGGILPGVYNTARRSPFTSYGNGLSFSGSGRGCNTLTGRFVVLEAHYGPAGIERFAADFEQHCEDAVPGLFGAIRYNSTISSLSPFGGVYPSWSLTIPTPSNGTVTSTGGLNCGTAGAACAATFGAATSVNLTATPDSGYIFAGWTEDCRGGPSALVHVNGPKRCGALFDLAVSPQPRTLMVFDSKAGDTIGGGRQQVYSEGNSRIAASANSSGTSLSLTVTSTDATREAVWRIDVSSPEMTTLTTGTYEGALSHAGQRPGLAVNFCSNSFGRFVVRELELNGTSVIRASIDLEIHCGASTDPGFFAALRYNASDVTTVPFGGSYPTYRLSVSMSGNGTITGGGLNCGTGGSTCELNPATPITVTVTAIPDSGHVFAGWTGGACFGAAATAVRVNAPKVCSAVFEPIVTTAPRTRAVFDYMAGAGGTGSVARQEGYSSLTSTWGPSISANRNALEFDVRTLDSFGFTSFRRFSFSVPHGQLLTVGVIYQATRYFPTAIPGMDAGLSCSLLTGRFVVRELVVAPGGAVERAAVDFEQHCNDIDPAVFGAIRYNSTLAAVPFEGQYPRYQLVVTAAAHGRVTAPGIACGGGGVVCESAFTGPSTLSMTATPDPGYLFAGWTGACHGGEAITFRLNTIRHCAAVFEPVVTSSPRTLLKMVSQPGESILQGRTEVYSLANSAWSVSSDSNRGGITFTVWGRGDANEARWTAMFRARTGDQLGPGTYTDASSSFGNQPYLSIWGDFRSCAVTSSRFVIRQLQFDSDNKVVRAAIDFEQHCDTISSPGLLGTLEYSSVPEVVPTASLDRTRLVFASTALPDNRIGNTTAPQQVRLSQTAGAAVPWTATTSASWLRVTPASGSGPSTLTVSVEPGIAGIGSHTAEVVVSANGTALPPVSVTWNLLRGGSPPFGNFDTPVAMTRDLTGAVALTGWALDDVEVTRVQIWRQSHPADPRVFVFQGPGPRNGKVFIGDATLVDGARPDVEARYNVPNRSRAGWGYMLLTRGLNWDGDGLFTVHAIATDRDGHITEIGSTTFSINNALATKPFGTIDTPGQGATVSGRYANTGWVLTPNGGASIAPENVRVVIDGAFLAEVPSVAARSDITAFFPTFDTSKAGRGLFIDTTALADGVHTIAWLATDSTGQADGIGSRYFRVANGGAGALAAAARAAARPVPGASVAAVDEAAQAMSAILVRRGFDPAAPFDVVYGSSEPYAVDFEELDRIEVRFPEATGGRATAYLRALGELRPLPAGASFDAARGVFTWQPGAGYIGRYDVVVVVLDRQGAQLRYEVQVTLQPRRK